MHNNNYIGSGKRIITRKKSWMNYAVNGTEYTLVVKYYLAFVVVWQAALVWSLVFICSHNSQVAQL